ncbi:MAG: fumarylacetoacetate hydrolase family protein [Pseudomonadales bacterium]|jgi:fumarylpyruvate hydrolase|nr:fumarylacetoacetate hydrolase family protein [Pseudomonadales bacterium]
MSLIFPASLQPTLPIAGDERRFPVHRLYCVGKNYAAHAREMGADPEREAPCFFLKTPDAIVLDGRVPYPSGTSNLHYEGELVIAIGKGGSDIAPEQALEHVFGYALGLDMTRRDLQLESSRRGQPWDTGKSFEHCAPLSAVVPLKQSGHFASGSLRLWLNGELRQDADFRDLIWANHDIISALSRLYTLCPGDLIFTGTPAGVGPVVRGDRIRLVIERLGELHAEIV